MDISFINVIYEPKVCPILFIKDKGHSSICMKRK